MKIRKPFVTHDELEGAIGGDWSPAAHTHVKADITDTPWAWADVSKVGSDLTDLATRQHAGLADVTANQHHAQTHTMASHSDFANWMDQAVREADSPTFNFLYLDSNLHFINNRLIKFKDSGGVLRNAIWFTGGDVFEFGHTGFDSKVFFDAFELSSLVADNKVQDSLRWNGVAPAGLTIGHVLKATGAAAFAFQANNLGGLSDVNLGALEEGETIGYDQATAKWIDIWGVEYDNPRLVWKMYTDFFRSHADANPPWTGVALAGATATGAVGSADHPGVIRLNYGTTIHSGYYFLTDLSPILIDGREHSEFVFKTTPAFTDKYIRLGFQDSINDAAPTDGIWIDISEDELAGKTSNGGAGSTTGTHFHLAANTWYRAKIAVNDAATLVTFVLYSAAGAQLWTNTLATNIPAGTTGHGVLAYIDVGGGAGILLYLDMMIATRAGTMVR